MAITSTIQHRRGADAEFKPEKMLPGEIAITTDGTRKVYAAFAAGDVKELAKKEDVDAIKQGGTGQGTGSGIATESDPTVPAWAKSETKPSYTSEEVGADPTGTAESKVSAHNTSEESHNDIRLLIEGLATRLNTLANSDDTTLDQMAEVVTYIKSNKSLIDAITISKVSVTDIIDNLTTSVSDKPLSAKQGAALKLLIDTVSNELSSYAKKATTLSGYGITDGATKQELSQLSEEIEAQQAQINNLKNPEAPTFVDSVDEMIDTSKSYVNTQTGTIWVHRTATYEKEVTITDEIDDTDDNPYYDGHRLGSSATSTTDGFTSGATGYHLTPLIDLTKYSGKTIQLHLEGANYVNETAATYITHRTHKPDGSIVYVRGNTTTEAAFLGSWTTAKVTINSQTSATIEIDAPLLYSSENVEVGYVRFCGKGAVADSNIYITYQDTQTVTEATWVDTRVSYGGSGIDNETLAKISALNNEGESPTTIKLLPQPVLDFYNADAYPDDDYTVTHLGYVTYPCRADIPVTFVVKWNYNENAMRTTVAVDTKAIGTRNAYTMKTYDVTGLNKYPLYNLLPNTTYYYKVTHVMEDGSLVEAKGGSFTTSSESIRLIYIDGTQNVRDLGGWTGLDGKKVKYGKIFRGAALSDSSAFSLNVTGKGKLAFGELKVQAELNLGAVDTETSIAQNCSYKRIGYTNYATAITGETYRAQFKEVLEYIVSCLDGTLTEGGLHTVERNIYFHCQGGCDRTGTLSFQLLGLLGVSESDLAKEYELSSFSEIGYGRLRTTTKAANTYDYVGMVEAIKAYDGTTISDKFYNFAIDCGLSADTITAFRNLMLE